MKKLVENLSVKDYDEVEDILFELLQEHYSIERYDYESLENGIEYVAGTINIVKLGDTHETLKHKQSGEWSRDIPITDSYRYTTYYRLDKLESLCKNTLTGLWSETYNFNRVLNKQVN